VPGGSTAAITGSAARVDGFAIVTGTKPSAAAAGGMSTYTAPWRTTGESGPVEVVTTSDAASSSGLSTGELSRSVAPVPAHQRAANVNAPARGTTFVVGAPGRAGLLSPLPRNRRSAGEKATTPDGERPVPHTARTAARRPCDQRVSPTLRMAAAGPSAGARR
jgi:hypothetical protein